MKKLIIPTLAILLLLTGCRQTAQLENGEDAVVSFKKGGISVDELYEELKDKYAFDVLLNMIDEDLLAKKYKETDEEKEYIENQKLTYQSYYQAIYSSQYSTYEEFLQAQLNVKNEDELDDSLRLSYRRNQAVEDYAKSIVSDDDIEDYYEDEYHAPMEASHILITADYDSDATDEEIKAAEDEALKQAKEIIEKLKKGEDFAELAKQYSKDGSASNGGALGKFSHGEMVTEFEDAAAKLKEGAYTTTPVKTKYGYHIILKTKQYDKEPLKDVKSKIVDILADREIEKDKNISYKALIDLREKNDVKFEDTDLAEMYENYTFKYED